MVRGDDLRRAHKVSILAEEALRIVAHYSAIDQREFANDSDVAQTRTTLKNGLMELFVVKFHILFSVRKRDKHRIGAFPKLEKMFLSGLGSSESVSEFDEYRDNIAKVRDLFVAHVDSADKVDMYGRIGARHPNLSLGSRYVVLLHDLISEKQDGVQRFVELEAAARLAWREM